MLFIPLFRYVEKSIYRDVSVVLVFAYNINSGFKYCFSCALAYSRISHEYSSLFIIVINLIFMFSL